MKSNCFFTRLCVLVLLFAGSAYSFAGIEADSIRPLTKVNKEFLIVAHIMMSHDSVPVVTTAEINNTIASVNTIFLPIGVSFKVCEFRYIYNYQYDTIRTSNGVRGHYEEELAAKYSVQNRLNMFFGSAVKVDTSSYCGFASLGGVTSHNPYVGAWIGCVTASTIAHELGHYFSLQHTFANHGTELVNGSNCSTAGDNICDTPADPFIDGVALTNYISPSCVFISEEKDANGDYYDPDVSNIMSYYTPCRCLKFSHDQYETMAEYYLSNPFVW